MELSFKLQALPGKTSVLSPAYPTCITTCACNATPSLHRYAEVESICGRAVLLHQQLNTPPSSKPVLVAKTMRALALVLLGRSAAAEPLAVSWLEAGHSLPWPPAGPRGGQPPDRVALGPGQEASETIWSPILNT